MILGVISYFVSQAFKDTIRTAILNSVSANTTKLISVNQLVDITLILIPIVAVFGGLIGGIILGLVFSAVHDKYMKSQTLPIRGLVFGVILFLIDLGLNSGSFSYGTSYVGANLGVSLVSSLIFGYLLGYFFMRFADSR